MMRHDEEFDSRLEQAAAEIRDEQMDAAAVEAAATRVWARLEQMDHVPLRSCADFQALMPDYRAGKLSEARALLLKDHTHECVACRKALAGETASPRLVSGKAGNRRWQALAASVPFRWAMAAALAVTVGLSSWTLWNRFGPAPAGRAMVQSVEGMLYRVTEQGAKALAAGEELAAGAEIRTAKDSHAIVRLRDGSLVEMRERSGFAVSETRRDATLQLGFGSIIVQAAKRRSGHLFVATRDCKVAVTGTVFSVNSGIKGSRVSVIEGEVHVTQGGARKVLHAGDQVSTNASMEPVPVPEEIAWSRNVDKHLALLRELSALGQKLEQVQFPELRYSSHLMGLLPADTAIYLAIPNLGTTLAEAHRIFREQIQDSPALRQWWEEKVDRGAMLEQTIARLRAFSEYLGDEVVIAARMEANGRLGEPVFLAELKRGGFREFIEAELRKVGGERDGLRIVDHPAAAPATGPVMLIQPNLVVLAHRASSLSWIRQGGGFGSAPFGARVSEAYRQGAGLLFSADLERITASASSSMPVENLKYIVVEHKQSGGKADVRALLTFRGARQGMASWLARPAPMGSLDFVTPEAGLVTAFAMKSPATVADEILRDHPDAQQGFRAAESELGVNLRNDLFAALGGDFAIALDGPALPVPSWKLAVEVYDPARLQGSIQKITEAFNLHAAERGKPRLQLTQEAANGRVFYTLMIPGARPFTEAHYVFSDGYLVAAPSRALLERALQTRATGYSLPRSAAFMALVPRDRYANFSGMVYHNLAPALGPLAGLLGSGGILNPGQQQSVQSIAANMKPTLVTAYGDDDRITLASNGSLFGLNMNNLLGIGLPFSAGPFQRGTRRR